MSCQADINIHAAMRAVSQALKLDSGNRQMDAYIHYLKCVQYIVQILLNDAQKPVCTENTRKCLKLSQQCFGRVEKLVDVFLSEKNISTPVQYEPNSPGVPVLPPATPTTPIVSPSSDFSAANELESTSSLAPISQVTSHVNRPKSLTPIEYAQRQNRQLMLAYKNRMAKMGNKSNTSSANMSLGLQRQMAENMAIAKTRQLALSKKVEERQKRFQQEAAKRLASMGGMSKDEKERMYLYTKILEYEQDTKWPLVWREKLKARPDDETLTLELIKTILKATDHPLSQVFVKYQRTVYNKVYPLVMKHIHQLIGIKVPYESVSNPTSDGVATKEVEAVPEEVKSENHNLTEETTGNEPDDSVNSVDAARQGYNDEAQNEYSPDNKPSIADVSEEVKSDLKTAIDEGESAMANLKKENINIMKRMESFDMDAMDELFSSSDEETEKTDKDDKSARTDSSSSSSLPYSSLSSRESVSSVDRLNDSGHIEELETEAIKRHLQNMILDVKESLDRLLGMFVVTYEQLGTPAGRDLCYSCLEEDFIKPLWPTILPLFRIANKEKEEAAAVVMTTLQQASPGDLRVHDKFRMESEDEPYSLVIQELHRLIELSSPLNKLESIVKLCRLICQCVEEYYQSQEKSVPSMGADDLLPVMCYVIVKSSTPQIVSECNAMEEFIPEGYLMGEEGYCLTSLQTALGYCLQMNEETPTA